MRLYDAHNHLQDERFGGRQEELLAVCRREGVAAMVVNGAGEADWPAVAALARRHPDLVIPGFGYHPWYVGKRTPAWREELERVLRETPGAVIGEIGLDRWKRGLDLVAQEEVFTWQLRLAAERNLPASIHCLQAWGKLVELLRAGPRPARGVLLHSYGGPVEMIAPLAALGAYFSLPGYFAHERKQRQRETLRHVPPDRFLIETDAPDQCLPEDRVKHRLPDPAASDNAERLVNPPTEVRGGAGDLVRGTPVSEPTREPKLPAAPDSHPAQPRFWGLNHPANLGAVYAFAAELLGRPLEDLAAQVEANFIRLFGRPRGVAEPDPAGPPASPPPAPPPQSQTRR
jgi:TatD DNase family protein